MLDAITDFWKPVKKNPPQAKPKLSDLQVGSMVAFGYVPQAALSGRRLKVSAVNSYQFGAETLTSFVLSQDKEADVMMIVADAQGEQYLAISRRISTSDRIRLFDENAIEDIISKPEISRLTCKDNVPEFKGWVVTGYKREIQAMSGRIYHKDIRKNTNGDGSGEEFKYTLLVSDSNEQAIEIEQYNDGRIEAYATVYRRTSDVTEIVHPSEPMRPDVKLVTKIEKTPAEETPVIAKPLSAPVLTAAAPEAVKAEEKKPEPVVAAQAKAEEKKPEPVKLEDTLAQLTPTALEPELAKPEPQKTEPAVEPKLAEKIEILQEKLQEKKDMATIETLVKPTNNNESQIKQEITTVTKTNNGMDNESVECELRVANEIIGEAIRSEMRLSDVVRRIVELPVAGQEAVMIPITLSDEDYSLLAIRYGIPASDRNAIKRRIIEDLNDFSGSKKLKAA